LAVIGLALPPGGTQVVYTGPNSTHIGVYTSVIRGLEEVGVHTDLVVNRLIDVRRPWTIPNDLARAYRGPVRWARGRIRGKVVGPFPFHYRFKSVYAAALAPVLSSRHSQRSPLIVHARTDHMAEAVLRLRSRLPGIRVVAELEGDLEMEVEYRRSKAEPRRRDALARQLAHHRQVTARVLAHSDMVLCVTQALKETFVRRFSLNEAAAQRIFVFPTLPSRREIHFDAHLRERFRRRLGLQDRYAVLYLGNVSTPWQVPDNVVALFREVQAVRTDAHLLVVTPLEERAIAQRLLHAHGLGQAEATSLSVDFEDVSGIISASDLGVALRENHPMNLVASPAKVSEYLLGGLPVVLSEGTGAFPGRLRHDRWAFFLREVGLQDEERAGFLSFVSRHCPAEDRARWGEENAARFSLEEYIPLLLKAYGLVSAAAA